MSKRKRIPFAQSNTQNIMKFRKCKPPVKGSTKNIYASLIRPKKNRIIDEYSMIRSSQVNVPVDKTKANNYDVIMLNVFKKNSCPKRKKNSIIDPVIRSSLVNMPVVPEYILNRINIASPVFGESSNKIEPFVLTPYDKVKVDKFNVDKMKIEKNHNSGRFEEEKEDDDVIMLNVFKNNYCRSLN